MDVNQVNREGGGPKDEGPSKADVAKATIDRLVADMVRIRSKGNKPIRDGSTGQKIDELGKLAKQYLSSIGPEIEASITADGKVPQPVYAKLRSTLFHLDKMERHIAEGPPKDADDGTVKKTVQVKDGKLAGPVTAGLRAFIQGFGLKPGIDDDKLSNILDGSIGKNLLDPGTWADVGGKMLSAMIKGNGDLSARLGDAVTVGAEAVVDAATSTPKSDVPVFDKMFGVTPREGLGLENTAGQTSNTGSATNAFAIRAQLLTGITGQNAKVANIAGKVCSEIFQDLGVFQDRSKLTPEDRKAKKEIHELITGEFDKLQVDGKIDASTLLARLAMLNQQEVGLEDTSAQMFTALTGKLAEMVAQTEGASDNKGVQEAFALGSSMALSDLVATKLDLKPNYGASLTERLVPKLVELVQTGRVTDPDAEETQENMEVDLSAYQTARPDLAEYKEAAMHIVAALEESGLGNVSAHESYETILNVLSHVLETAEHNDIPEPIAAYQWLAEHAGLPQPIVDQMIRTLEHQEPYLADITEKIDGIKAQIDKIESKGSGSGTDHDRLDELTMQLAQAESRKRNAEDRPRTYFMKAASMIAETCASGNGYGPAPDPADGGGGKKPPGTPPNKGTGDDDPPDSGDSGQSTPSWSRMRNRMRGNMVGMTTASGPHDQGDEPFYQKRANMLGDVLADSSLCIEDKIFFFMMWFVSFADEEREKKMEELTHMDEKQARNAELKDKAERDQKSQFKNKRHHTDVLTTAKNELKKVKNRQPPPTPEVLQKAEEKVDQAQGNLDQCEGKLTALEEKISGLRRKAEELPKSREVKFMELERLNQLRDKIMNMARSILENSNRNIEKIFR